MQPIMNLLAAVFNFVVGDMRLLVGTLLALIVTGLLVQVSPQAAGALLFVMLAATLAVALQRETRP